jgi:hypothetical protein
MVKRGYRIRTLVAPFSHPSPRRDPRVKPGEGSRATGSLLQPWIPAFAGMTTETETKTQTNHAIPLPTAGEEAREREKGAMRP